MEHGRRSLAAGRGRKAPEQGIPGARQGPLRMGEDVRAPEQGHLMHGGGAPAADHGNNGHKDINSSNKQDPRAQEQGNSGHLEADGGTLEAPYCVEAISITGRDALASNMDQMTIQGKQRVSNVGPGPGSQGDNRTPAAINLNSKGGERWSPGLNRHTEYTEMDIRELLWALPTNTDIQQLISAVEQSCLQAVEGLREDTQALGHRVEKVENDQEVMVHAVADVQDAIKNHEDVLNSYRDQLNDYENRDRRQNIRIKGLPESIQTPELISTVQKIFCHILGDFAPEIIELDWAHRIPSHNAQKVETPRDVICKVHKYAVKESIMKMARSKPEIVFDGINLALYPDISRRTLYQRRLVRPLLEALCFAKVKYWWGFPFSLTASRIGKTATLCTKDDLEPFVEILDLPLVDFTDWRINYLGLLLQ